MGTALELIVAILLPTAVGYAAVLAVRAHRWTVDHRPPAPEKPIEQLGADLRRLHADLDRIEAARALPAKKLRCDAVRAAYVDTLSLACTRLDIPPPIAAANTPVPWTEIYRAEAALRRRGVDVRATSAR